MEFTYVTRTKEGEIKKGVMESPSRKEAIVSLQGQGLIILEMKATAERSVFEYEIKIFRRVRPKEMVAFSRQLAILFSAKISLLESIRTMGRQTTNKYFGQILFDIANDVEAGSPFSRALAKYPKIFSSFFINLIKTGEVTGGLDRSLTYLADYTEKQYYLNSKIRGAMVYPAFILGGFIVVGVAMMIFVVPQLTSFLQETGQELPLPTKMLIWTSEFIRHWGWLIGLAVVSLVAGASYSVKRYLEARYWFDLFKIKIPIFKNIFNGFYLDRMTDNLCILIQGGLPILQALQISADVVGNVIFRDILVEAKESVRVGNSMSSALAKHPEIPPMVVQMIATGEETGSLDDILKKLSVFYGKEVDAMVATLSQLIEPVLMVILGIGVAILMASILIPIYNIASSM